MKIGIETFEYFHGRRNIGSSMIRARWLLPDWPDAELLKIGKKYDCVIYQKAYDTEHARLFDGIKILDVCDPDYFHWGYPFKEMCDLCDAVVCATEALARDIKNFTYRPVYYIPDRISRQEVCARKEHAGQGQAKTAVWFGYSDTFQVLEDVLPAMVKNKLNLIIISNQAMPVPTEITKKIEITNLPWSEAWQQDIIKGDIVINPKLKGGKWAYKSENKTRIAWALNMPVAKTEEEMLNLLPEAARVAEADNRQKEIDQKYLCKYSVKKYEQIIKDIQNQK